VTCQSIPVTPLTDAQRWMIEKHISYAESVATIRAYALPPHIRDLVIAAAWWGLVMAAVKYDSTMGMSERSYVAASVHWAILDELQSQLPMGYRRTGTREGMPRIVQLPYQYTTEDQAIDAALVLRDDNRTTTEDRVREVERMLAAHPVTRNRKIALAYFGRAGATMAQVGQEYGLSESTVSVIISKVIQDVRLAFGVKPKSHPPDKELDHAV